MQIVEEWERSLPQRLRRELDQDFKQQLAENIERTVDVKLAVAEEQLLRRGLTETRER